MPSVHDLPDRYAEYLQQTDMSASSRSVYTTAVRSFASWLARHPRYGDALIDVKVRDAALAAYWRHMSKTKSPATLHVARHALTRMFSWLELPEAEFSGTPHEPGPPVMHRYGKGTSMHWRGDEPFKAKAVCVDGRLRTTDRLSMGREAGQYGAAVSVMVDGVRRKISGTITIESASGSPVEGPDDPLVVKFEAHEHGAHAPILGYGLWREDRTT